MELMVTALMAAMVVGTSGTEVGATFEYASGGVTCEGYAAMPEERRGAGAVVIVHDWDGLTAYERGRADQIAAEYGIPAVAIDVYGKGVRPVGQAACAAEAGKYYGDAGLFRGRLKEGLEAAAQKMGVKTGRIVVMGYCFGGTAAMEMSRAGMGMGAWASFHGGMKPIGSGTVSGTGVVFHAAHDPVVPKADFVAFLEEMQAGKGTIRVEVYNIATHAFTVQGPMYDATADRLSWEEFGRFLRDVGALGS